MVSSEVNTESRYVMFVTLGVGVFLGILGSAVLSFIISLIALRRINKFKSTNINKF